MLKLESLKTVVEPSVLQKLAKRHFRTNFRPSHSTIMLVWSPSNSTLFKKFWSPPSSSPPTVYLRVKKAGIRVVVVFAIHLTVAGWPWFVVIVRSTCHYENMLKWGRTVRGSRISYWATSSRWPPSIHTWQLCEDKLWGCFLVIYLGDPTLDFCPPNFNGLWLLYYLERPPQPPLVNFISFECSSIGGDPCSPSLLLLCKK